MDFKTCLKKRDAIAAIQHLEDAGFQARLAGGCVRDLILGLSPADFDVATTSLPEETQQVFQNLGMKVVPTGLEHGTVTVVFKSGPVEVTTLRTDEKTDGRHAEVKFSCSWQEDAGRRDFTVNALYEDKGGKIYDYFHGLDDLKNKRLRFVGDADARIQEDYLRILRFFRFKGQLGFFHDSNLEAAINKNLEGIQQLSQERVTSEIKKLFGFVSIRSTLYTMIETEVFAKLFFPWKPSYQELLEKLELLGGCHTKLRCLGRLFFLWSYQESLNKTRLGSLVKKWKLSNEDKSLMQLFLGAKSIEIAGLKQSQVMQLIDSFDTIKLKHEEFFEALMQACMLLFPSQQAKYKQLMNVEALKGHIRRKKIPIDGKDLIGLGLEPGPDMGEALMFLKTSFRDELWSERADGHTILKSYLEK